jgi:hypothetical protein
VGLRGGSDEPPRFVSLRWLRVVALITRVTSRWACDPWFPEPGCGVVLLIVVLLLTRRTARRETARHRDQAQLRELLQASESEQESRTLLIRHIQTLLPGCDPAVLSLNHDNDRLQITAVGPSDALAVRAGSERLRPRSCMAVRLEPMICPPTSSGSHAEVPSVAPQISHCSRLCSPGRRSKARPRRPHDPTRSQGSPTAARPTKLSSS